jgi:dipeptidyl aminopeptidase/acylaminoacyl peptidase
VIKSLLKAVVTAAAVTFASVATAAPSPEVFGTLPAVQSVRMSPSGKYFSATMNVNGQPSVRVYDSETMQQVGGVGANKQQTIGSVRWRTDDRLVVSVIEVVEYSDYIVRDKSETGGTNVCQILSVSRDGKNVIQIKPPGKFKNFPSCAFVGWGAEPNTMIIANQRAGANRTGSRAGADDDVPALFLANLLTGETRLIDEVAYRGTSGWFVDRTGAVRLRYDAGVGEGIVNARLAGSTEWREVLRVPAGENIGPYTGNYSRDVELITFADDLNKVYVKYWPGDRAAIGLLDLQTSNISMVYADPKYDMTTILGVREEGVAGVFVERDVPTQIFFDQKLKSIQSNLLATYPGHIVQIVSASDNLGKVAVYIEGPQAPGGAYQVLDTVKNEAATVSRAYPTLDNASLGQKRYITYKTRDGETISAYLTLPNGSSGRGLPAVVVPHGGPEARDSGYFEYLSQFLASRGYAVLQPQYRGSDGYGIKFAFAGRRQWGRRMQDDVSDGVKHLIANGTVDANRVCIAGWSYGGYAALAGATLTPELYRCVIAGAGPSDLVEMLIWSRRYAGGKEGSIRYWRRHIGDPTADKASIDAVSPAKLADRVRAPILLIHGELDNVVPIKQSEIMADALKAAGKPYEFTRLANENHNITFQSTRIKTLQAMDAFLAKHNPAR